MPRSDWSVVKNYALTIPPAKAEQEAIAEALSDADALIESLEQLIAKKRQIKQGAMQELLRPKDGWVSKKLGDIAHIKTGSRNNQDKVEDGKYPFFVRSQIVERINSYSYDCEAILIPGEGGIGSIFHYVNGRFDVHQRVYAISQFAENIPGKYVYYFMVKNFGQHAMQNSVKATVDSLRLPTFQQFQVFMPKRYDEQSAIASVLSDMDAEIDALELKLEKARWLKQGMMHNLLTGKIRLVGGKRISEKDDAEKAVKKGHNWQIDEAVLISVLTKNFGSVQYPLGRKRRTKLLYLFHRHMAQEAIGFKKKAAGPYNPEIRYGGPEKIALQRSYVCEKSAGNYQGFVLSENFAEADNYFNQWYDPKELDWLEQFRYSKNDELELLTTVDMAMVDLKKAGAAITLHSVKQVIGDHPEWAPKLQRSIFSDEQITFTIERCKQLFYPDYE